MAVREYSHSTAPNRRFPDLITQRLLKAALAGGKLPYSPAELTSLATHCTEQEDAATKVERQVRKSAAAQFLSGRIGETFDALVTGASEKGTWVRLLKPPAEGKLVRGQEGVKVGDQIKVQLASLNIERGFIDFALTCRWTSALAVFLTLHRAVRSPHIGPKHHGRDQQHATRHFAFCVGKNRDAHITKVTHPFSSIHFVA